MALYGYDVSKWQAVGTGDSAKNFLIIKATEGVGYVDGSCDKHYQRAKKQGKLPPRKAQKMSKSRRILASPPILRPKLTNSAKSDKMKTLINSQI